MKILLASHNPGKIKEMKRILQSLPGIEILTLDDLKITKEAKENYNNFQQNSLQKAKFYAQISQMPTIADDGGLEIDDLNGEPGVKSRRWLGYAMTDQELIDEVLKRIKNIQKPKRTARFRTVSTFYNPLNGKFIQAEGVLECIITQKPNQKIDPGYPFRSILLDPKTKRYLVDFDQNESFLSHRVKSLTRLKKYLVKK